MTFRRNSSLLMRLNWPLRSNFIFVKSCLKGRMLIGMRLSYIII